MPNLRQLVAVFAIAASFVAVPALAGVNPAHAAGARTGAHESENPIEDQGSNYDYRSYITAIAPRVPGLEVQVLEFADRLLLTNHTGRDVTVDGYSGEPYARVLADGAVQVNTNSPAYYLNQNFYGNVTVPATATPRATPHWTLIDRTGQLEWHDHRIHWMSPVPPATVKDKSRRTKIFDWSVPIEVGASGGAVSGELFWTPEGNSKTPAGAIAALVAIVLLGSLLVLVVRRRRATRAAEGSEDSSRSGRGEAW